MRIVSLVPSATETLYALGVEPDAVSHACDYPPAARQQPTITTSRIPSTANSSEINELVADTANAIQIDANALEKIDPDLVITQGLCSVCAVDDSRVRTILEDRRIDADVIVDHPHGFADTLDSIERIGTAIGRPDRASDLRSHIETRLERIRRNLNSRPRHRTAVLDWMDPPMVAGHWVPDLVEFAGGAVAVGGTAGPSGPVEWEPFLSSDPAVILVAPCGYPIEQTVDRRAELTDRPGWDDLQAVTRDAVYVLDGNHLVNRPGPRLIDTVRVFASTIHPERFGSPPQSLAVPFPNAEDAADLQ